MRVGIVFAYTAPLLHLRLSDWRNRAAALEAYCSCPGIDWRERLDSRAK